MRVLLAAGAVAGALTLACAANAALLDFTSGAAGVPTGTVAGVSYAITSNGVVTNNEAQDGSSCFGHGLACEIDGLGVGDDEITGGAPNTLQTGEWLTVTFDRQVRLTGVAVLDLFYSNRGAEAATIAWQGGSATISAAELEDSGLSGFAALNFITGVLTNFVSFTAANLFGDNGNNDYAVAALSYEPVPLPAALPLFLAGLAGLGFARARKRQTA
ncbi:MAG: VPLPA-CTERM sorting domain-containing protein [Alphaproteobacteria bacterium]|nr:VPLPA-CTERM sorting domain-containing protein [Alphaproteobacteria bacterium]